MRRAKASSRWAGRCWRRPCCRPSSRWWAFRATCTRPKARCRWTSSMPTPSSATARWPKVTGRPMAVHSTASASRRSSRSRPRTSPSSTSPGRSVPATCAARATWVKPPTRPRRSRSTTRCTCARRTAWRSRSMPTPARNAGASIPSPAWKSNASTRPAAAFRSIAMRPLPLRPQPTARRPRARPCAPSASSCPRPTPSSTRSMPPPASPAPTSARTARWT